jgi:general stress protein 26
MVLATSSRKGELHTATIAYNIDDNFTFSLLTTTSSSKYKNLLENKNVAFTVGFGPDLVTVQGGGTAQILSDDDAIEVGLRFKNRPHPWPLLSLETNNVCAFRITPTWLSMLSLQNEEYPELASKEFHKII